MWIPRHVFVRCSGLAYAPLCRYARHRGLTGPDAEDLVAQTMEIAWRRLDDVPTTEPTLWVDARAYVPLRSVSTMRAGPDDQLLEANTTDYQVLPATPANLALLTPPIPAGFTRIPKSPRF